MNKKTFITALASIAGVGLFLAFAFLITNKPQNTYFEDLKTYSEADHVKWAKKGSVVIIEYSDFQCPACSQYFSLLKALEEDPDMQEILQNQVSFVYRHYPLENIHPFARVAAQVAESAGKQGAFFEMHDLLFTNQDEWVNSSNQLDLFKEYAQQLSLDLDRFESDINDSSIVAKIESDVVSGNTYQVQGTPTFFINGVKINNPQSYEELKNAILTTIQTNNQTTSEESNQTN